ncbi:ribonuclease HI family protein [Planctomonas sp. JC2975]|uniref:RNase H family protein n=1 Tax=Planctomonas sp. JC2975 TaxID=2729626 RepID=UPI001473C798|nr:RNase H family protein [Planctomonas sp. JC2975]NNC10421.1 ribonuclease HI family protein [Planctomonas sp. JC2975]
MTIIAAADGSALGNPGPAGWAWYVDDDTWAAGGWPHGTNNMGELMAVIDLFESTAGESDDLRVLCDSQYVINAVTKWMPGWKRRGWRKADGSPVQNLDLLKRLDAALAGRDYAFEWVRGHNGHELNEAADERARGAATAYQKRAPVDGGPGWGGTRRSGTSIVSTDAGPTHGQRPEMTDAGQAPAPTLFDELPLDETDEETVLRQERALLDPRIREDVAEIGVLLHPEFVEVGRSGRLWSKDEVALSPVTEGTIADIVSVDLVSPGVMQLVYRTTDARGTTLRSSLWLRSGPRWRLRFHQGTPATD